MILEVHFLYGARVRGPRQINVRENVYVERVAVDVPEVDPSDAPVVLRAEFDGRREDRVLREYRMYDGCLWLPDGDADGIRGKAYLEAAAVAAAGGSVPRHDDPFHAGACGHGTFKGRIEADPGARTVVDSDVDRRRDEVRAAASGRLVVAGVVHRRTPEPIYEVSDTDRYTFLRIRDGRASWAESGDDNYGVRRYRADEIGHVLARHEIAETTSSARRIEVVDPSAVRAPLPELALARAASLVRERLGEYALERDVAFFAHYASLRDAERALTAALRRGEDPRAAGEALAPALREAADLLAAQVGGRYGAGHVDFRTEWAREALQRLDDRTLGEVATPSWS